MTDQHADLARRVAARLSPSLDASLPALTERVLADKASGTSQEQVTTYDPTLIGLGLASLLVSAAAAGWRIYWDIRTERKKTAEAAAAAAAPDPKVTASRRQVLVRRIRVAVLPQGHSSARGDAIIEAVADELLLLDEHQD